ncbi:MAG: DNA polymerase III subunit chi [Pseudomonadota bacterium]
MSDASPETRSEVWFYHLERQRLEDVLPSLLEKTLQKGWRAVVQAGSSERVAALSDHLWTYDNASFLPHGAADDGAAEAQPVFLTDDGENPNGAQARFLVDGAQAGDLTAHERSIFLFDGHDEAAVNQARATWRAAKDAGCAVTYWQQSAAGRWEKKA